MKVFEKYNLEEAKDAEVSKDNQIICPHCKQAIKKGELKIGKDKKSVIHGKCEGKIYFSEDLVFEMTEELFENKGEYIKGKMTNMLAKAVKSLDISDIGDVGQRSQPDELKSSNPLKDAKQRKHNKTFDPPKQNQ